MRKIIAVALIFILLSFPPLADAYLGAAISFATVLRVGAIYVAQLWRNDAVRSVVVSVLGHVAAGTLAYLAYDRGTAKPPEERYVTVQLKNTQDAIKDGLAKGEFPVPPAPTWATSILGTQSSPGWYSEEPVPAGSTACLYMSSDIYGNWQSSGFLDYVTSSTVVAFAPYKYYKKMAVCSSGLKTAYTDEQRAESVISDSSLGQKYADAIGKDVSLGSPVFSSSPPSGAVVVNVAGDVYETNNYGDANNFISAGSGSNTSSGSETGITKQEVQDAVGGAITEKLGTDPGGLTSPSYDDSYENPTENNISDRITSFIGSNPIIGAINGTHLSLSGAVCTASIGSAFGKPLTLDFCWMESYLIMFGNVLVIFAGLTAAFIIFRRGD